jgi:hypothetical protein
MVVSSDSMKKATATSHGSSRFEAAEGGPVFRMRVADMSGKWFCPAWSCSMVVEAVECARQNNSYAVGFRSARAMAMTAQMDIDLEDCYIEHINMLIRADGEP